MKKQLGIRMLLFRFLGVLMFLFISFSGQIALAEDFIQAPAAIHMSSTVSDGKYTRLEIIEIAKQNNIKVVIITDRDLMHWEYGLWPLRNIVKKTVEDKSLFKYGIKRYLEEIKNLQKENPGLVLIPAIESAPFYYWQGNVFKNLTMYNWHKHLLVMGLETVKDYENLPLAGNGKGLVLPFRFKDIYRLWPILIILIGILCLYKRQFNYKDLYGRQLGPFSRKWQICGGVLTIIGLLFLLNNYPFRNLKFDQYQGDLGIKPYQDFIDYVNKAGGLAFWAHPEAENIEKIGKVNIETREHTRDLLWAYDYSGFAIFYEGYKKVGCLGGLWDEILCQGKRKAPIWAIAGLSFDSTGNLSGYMKELRTVLLMRGFTKQKALEALKKGRMYAMIGARSSEFVLDKFIIKDILNGAEKTMGEEIESEEKPQLQISGHFLNPVRNNIGVVGNSEISNGVNGQNKPLKIRLIKNGVIIKTFEATSPFDISYEDENNEKDAKFYYRLEIESEGILVVTNPIFVVRQN